MNVLGSCLRTFCNSVNNFMVLSKPCTVHFPKLVNHLVIEHYFPFGNYNKGERMVKQDLPDDTSEYFLTRYPFRIYC